MATAVPQKAPTRLVNAASMIACRGVSTRVETTVAMALAASWKPLMYSNTTATTMTSTISRKGSMTGGAGRAQAYLRAIWNTTLPASRQWSIARSRSS